MARRRAQRRLLAINVSRIQFRKRFSKRLAELMTTYRIPPHALEFEITESVLLDDHIQVAEELAACARSA